MNEESVKSNRWRPNRSNTKAAAILGLCFAVSVLAMATFPFPTTAQQSEFSGEPISYEHLSDEESEPYESRGKPPQRREYKRAVKRFSNVRDCLVKAEREKEVPDLRKINWRRMTSTANISVCMFRIFASYGTPEKAVLWFEAQGLETMGPTKRKFAFKPTIVVQGHNFPTKQGHVYVSSSWLGALLDPHIIYSERFAASWDEGGILTATGYTASSK